MLTYKEEIQLHRLRDWRQAFGLAFWLALALGVILVAAVIAAGAGPSTRACLALAGFEFFAALLSAAGYQNVRRRIRELEELDC